MPPSSLPRLLQHCHINMGNAVKLKTANINPSCPFSNFESHTYAHLRILERFVYDNVVAPLKASFVRIFSGKVIHEAPLLQWWHGFYELLSKECMCCCEFRPDIDEEVASFATATQNEINKAKWNAYLYARVRFEKLDSCEDKRVENAMKSTLNINNNNTNRDVLSQDTMRMCILFTVLQRLMYLLPFAAMPSIIAFCIVHSPYGNERLQYLYNSVLSGSRMVLIYYKVLPSSKSIAKKL